MTGHTKFKDIRHKIDDLPPQEREALREQARESRRAQGEAYEQSLGQLRKARGLTQVQVAKALGVSQTRVSKIERRTDFYLSTLVSYLEAMDADLELTAVLADGQRVPLQIGDLISESDATEPEAEAGLGGGRVGAFSAD